MLTDAFRAIVNKLFKENFNTIFMRNRKIYQNIKVMFGNNFCFLFLKSCFWEYK